MNTPVTTHFKGIIDSTLREGMQFARSRFTLRQQVHIARLLSGIGVDYIEVGNPISVPMRPGIETLIRSLKGSGSAVLTHIRNRREDVNAAIECAPRGVNMLCTVDPERLNAMGLTREAYLMRMRTHVTMIREAGMEIRVSVEDYFNRQSDACMDIFETADVLQVDRIGVADTLGSAMPWRVSDYIAALRRAIAADIEVHFHNDLGNAVANAIAAVAAGANYIDTTLLGIGERTGIPSLSQILSNLYVIDQAFSERYGLGRVTAAENYVAGICGIDVPFNIITNTSNAFAHKAGIHLNAMIKHGPQKYELFPPRIIGNRRHLLADTEVSGRTTDKDIELFYKLHGI